MGEGKIVEGFFFFCFMLQMGPRFEGGTKKIIRKKLLISIKLANISVETSLCTTKSFISFLFFPSFSFLFREKIMNAKCVYAYLSSRQTIKKKKDRYVVNFSLIDFPFDYMSISMASLPSAIDNSSRPRQLLSVRMMDELVTGFTRNGEL